jgi:transposase
MRLNLELWGELYTPPSMKLGRPRTLTHTQEAFVLSYLQDQPTAYLDEVCQVVFDEFEVEASEWTIYRILERNQWSRKITQQRAAQQSALLRATWRGRQLEWAIEDLCFVDESASNERTGDRKWGWAPLNLSPVNFVPLQRSKRWSILPALMHKGYLDAPLIYQGGVNSDLFTTWLEFSVIPQLDFGPGRQPRIILDNASIHRSKEVKDLCELHSVELSYLPPYSPDMNPIEKTFSMLKSWMKRNNKLATEFDNFGAFLQFALGQLRLHEVAVKFIQHAGYT